MNLKYYLRGLGLGFIVAALILGIHHFRNSGSDLTDDQIKARAEKLGMVDASAKLTDEAIPDAEELLESIDEPAPPEKEEIPIEDTTTEPDMTDVPMDDVTAEIPEVVTDDPDAWQEDQAAVESMSADSGESTDEGTNAGTGEDNEAEAGNVNTDASAADSAEAVEVSDSTDTAAGSAKSEDAQTSESTQPADDGNVNVVGGQITIVSGDSSDRVARKLQDAGIVASAADYDRFLCQNNYDRYIRTGTYTIPAGSSDADIAKLITGR